MKEEKYFKSTPMQELFKKYGHLLPDVEKEFLEKEKQRFQLQPSQEGLSSVKPLIENKWISVDEKLPEPKLTVLEREYFAAMAMQGLMASMTEKASIGNWGTEQEEIAKAAIKQADELLKQLSSEALVKGEGK